MRDSTQWGRQTSEVGAAGMHSPCGSPLRYSASSVSCSSAQEGPGGPCGSGLFLHGSRLQEHASTCHPNFIATRLRGMGELCSLIAQDVSQSVAGIPLDRVDGSDNPILSYSVTGTLLPRKGWNMFGNTFVLG